MINFAGGWGLFFGLIRIRRVFLTIQTFFKAKKTICKYWTLTKIKIGMTCVCKEYVGTMKIVQEQRLHHKMEFFLAYNMEIVFSEREGLIFDGGNKNLVGVYWGIFSRWGEISNFWNILFSNILKWTHKIYLMVDMRQQVS